MSIRNDEHPAVFRANLTKKEKEKVDKILHDYRNIGNALVRTGDVLAAILIAATDTTNEQFVQKVKEILKGD